MKPIILVVEDNEDILFNLKLIFEANNYETLTAKNGKEALETLAKTKYTPEVIISDIMMPEVNGYDFFSAVSADPRWYRIPFIFLTAKSSIKDVRFGKMLGVDDYLTKPFKEEDLLAIVAGKIKRNKHNTLIDKKVEEIMSSLSINFTPSITSENQNQVIIMLVFWDDIYGPKLDSYFPKDEKLPFSIKEISTQLFNSILSIYGHDNIETAEGVLIKIENIKRHGYIYYDAVPDSSMRGGEKQHMLALIAPKINYLESLKIKEIFNELSLRIKKDEDFDLQKYWEKISKALTIPSF